MSQIITTILFIHILAGGIALISGAVAIITKKGGKKHRVAGKVYFVAMTIVFITALVVATYKFNRFLFLIGFLSYYSVFSGLRALKLKKLHLNQKPLWYDWASGFVNIVANLVFLFLGLYYLLRPESNFAGAILSIGFAIGGLAISYTNMKPLIIKPDKPYHWYLSHIGNMMGGYIATLTAFLSTMVTRFELMNPYIAFALPSLIGVPLIIYWQSQIEKQFKHATR